MVDCGCVGCGWTSLGFYLGEGNVLRRYDSVVSCPFGSSIDIVRLTTSRQGFGEGVSQCFVHIGLQRLLSLSDLISLVGLILSGRDLVPTLSNYQVQEWMNKSYSSSTSEEWWSWGVSVVT